MLESFIAFLGQPFVQAPLVVGGITAVLALIISVTDRFVNDYGDLKLDINKGKKDLEIKGGSPLLQTLSEQGIFIPSACGGRGSCGACKVKVTSDVGPILPTETAWLTMEEIDDNIRLSCQIKIKQDIEIEIPEELFYVKQFKCTVEKIEDLTYDIKRVLMRIVDGQEIEYQAGQYAQILIPPFKWAQVEKAAGEQNAKKFKDTAIVYNRNTKNDQSSDFPAKLRKGEVNNGDTVQRAYSMSSVPSDKNHIEMMIRLVPGGVASTYTHSIMKEGQDIGCVGPFGDFFVQPTKATMLCVAGGSGMAPIKSILYDLKEKGETDREIWYFFGARTPRDLFMVEELKALEKEMPNFKFIPALSDSVPEDNWDGDKGLITEVLDRYLKEEISDKNGFEGYLCGSPGMINACIKVMKDNGLTDENIYFDSFA
jgi:Na+-transporting NADH:ubiquinone oxidoreductase subunit F